MSAVLDGSIEQGGYRTEDVFGLLCPLAVPGVPANILLPRNTWADKTSYDQTSAELKKRFEDNYREVIPD